MASLTKCYHWPKNSEQRRDQKSQEESALLLFSWLPVIAVVQHGSILSEPISNHCGPLETVPKRNVPRGVAIAYWLSSHATKPSGRVGGC